MEQKDWERRKLEEAEKGDVGVKKEEGGEEDGKMVAEQDELERELLMTSEAAIADHVINHEWSRGTVQCFFSSLYLSREITVWVAYVCVCVCVVPWKNSFVFV